jgi:hypothetical protein
MYEYTVLMYTCRMIVSFGDKTTEDIFHGLDTKSARRIAQVLWTRVQAKAGPAERQYLTGRLARASFKPTGEAAR